MRRPGSVLAVVSLLLLAVAPSAAGGPPTSCREPAASWERADPADVALDPDRLEAALDFARPRMSQEIAVYRHGCLVAERRWEAEEDARYDSWSIAKSVTAMAAGRAITRGLLDVDDRIGRYVPEAEGRHRSITVGQLLTMTTGLHWNLFRDYNIAMPDRVKDALSLEIDHEPGTFFEYAQSPVALLAKVVGNAARRDFQDFVQDELFGPLGIGEDRWTWERDRAGNTVGFMGLRMTVDDYARLGQLMHNRGVWRGKRLLDAAFVRDALKPSRTNPGYGYMFWLNRGKRYIAPTVYSRDERDHRHVLSAPKDMFYMAGIHEQRVWVVPSLGLMVVRVGGSGSRDPDTRSSVFTSASGDFEHEFFRLLMAAVKDRKIPDPGPYEYGSPAPDLDPDYGMLKSAREPEDIAAGFGLPP